MVPSSHQLEPPLNDRELRIVRGMIDEHEYNRVRNRFLSDAWRDSRAVFAVFAGVVLALLQIATLLVALGIHR